jgi:hypothetical protein
MDLDQRLSRIEDKLDAMLDAVRANSQSVAVHGVICDADRTDVRADVVHLRTKLDSIDLRLWKVMLAMAGAGGVGAVASKAIAQVLGG